MLRVVIGMVLMMAGGALLGWAAVVAIVGIGAQLKLLRAPSSSPMVFCSSSVADC
jgi:hypothetical protein